MWAICWQTHIYSVRFSKPWKRICVNHVLGSSPGITFTYNPTHITHWSTKDKCTYQRAIWKTWPDLTLSHHIASVTGTWRTGLLLLHLINRLCNHMGSGKSMVNKSTQFYTIPYNLALFPLNLRAHKITTMLCWRQNNWQHNCIRELLSFTPGYWQS